MTIIGGVLLGYWLSKVKQVYEGRTHDKYKRKPEQQPKQPEPGLGS